METSIAANGNSLFVPPSSPLLTLFHWVWQFLVLHLRILGQFFSLGSCLVIAKDWNDRPGRLKQAGFIKQAVLSWEEKADQPRRKGLVSVFLFISLVTSSLVVPGLTGCAPCKWVMSPKPIREGVVSSLWAPILMQMKHKLRPIRAGVERRMLCKCKWGMNSAGPIRERSVSMFSHCHFGPPSGALFPILTT